MFFTASLQFSEGVPLQLLVEKTLHGCALTDNVSKAQDPDAKTLPYLIAQNFVQQRYILELLREACRSLPQTMHRTSQMILRLRLSSARVGRESSRVLLGPGGIHFTVPYSSTVSGDSRPLKGQHNFVHGVAKRSSSAYEAAASNEVSMRFHVSIKGTGERGY